MKVDPRFESFLEDLQADNTSKNKNLNKKIMSLVDLIDGMEDKDIIFIFGRALQGIGKDLLGKKVIDTIK